jgi:hypothetical protein
VLKNSLFVSNSQNWGDRKCLPDPRRSIVGLPDAILFLRILRVGVFQQPQAIALKTPVTGSMSEIAICQQLTEDERQQRYVPESDGSGTHLYSMSSASILKLPFVSFTLCTIEASFLTSTSSSSQSPCPARC